MEYLIILKKEEKHLVIHTQNPEAGEIWQSYPAQATVCLKAICQ